MSENTGSTQPIQSIKEDDTQPLKPIKKAPRWKPILISSVGFLLLIGLGALGGYSSGIGDRKSAENAIVSKQLSEQYTFALVDIESGRYEAAIQRLEFIIANDPGYPGARDKLTEVLVISVIPTPTLTPTLTATPDFSGAESAYQRAQQLINAQDWPGALAALDTIRKLDSTYKTAQVDGMYYFALRNYGYALITQQGNLEGGIYQLTLAERFGPLDNTAAGLSAGARQYIIGASFWELDWQQAAAFFYDVGNSWPAMWDGTMTAAERLYIASMRYGDDLYTRQDYCGAYEQYQNAQAIGELDSTAARNADDAFEQCYPPTATLEPVLTTLPTTEVLPTDVPTLVPTP